MNSDCADPTLNAGRPSFGRTAASRLRVETADCALIAPRLSALVENFSSLDPHPSAPCPDVLPRSGVIRLDGRFNLVYRDDHSPLAHLFNALLEPVTLQVDVHFDVYRVMIRSTNYQE